MGTSVNTAQDMNAMVARVVVTTPLRKDHALDGRMAAWMLRMARRGCEWLTAPCEPVDAARNNLVEWAQRNIQGWTHLFWVDADVQPPLAALDWLLSHRRPIVGGYYPLRINDASMWSFKPADQWYQGREPLAELGSEAEPLIPVKHMGAGCALIAREVYDTIPWPWYRFEFKPMGPDGATVKTGEDVWFCDRAAEAGYEIAVDLRCACAHYNRVRL